MSRMKPTNAIEGVVKASIFVCGGRLLVLSSRTHSNEHMTRLGRAERRNNLVVVYTLYRKRGQQERVANRLAFIVTIEITVIVFK